MLRIGCIALLYTLFACYCFGVTETTNFGYTVHLRVLCVHPGKISVRISSAWNNCFPDFAYEQSGFQVSGSCTLVSDVHNAVCLSVTNTENAVHL